MPLKVAEFCTFFFHCVLLSSSFYGYIGSSLICIEGKLGVKLHWLGDMGWRNYHFTFTWWKFSHKREIVHYPETHWVVSFWLFPITESHSFIRKKLRESIRESSHKTTMGQYVTKPWTADVAFTAWRSLMNE